MQNSAQINIGKKDVIWNYLATFLQIGSGVLLFPIILRMLPSETVGVWSIFLTISSFTALLDFGFSPSFTRNVSYIFSGVNKLEKTGISQDFATGNINFDLLGSTIRAMKWFYSRIALLVLLLLVTCGSAYLFHILHQSFEGDKMQIGIAWLLFCFVNTYNIYTFYYDSLIMGSGKVMKDKQIIIASQIVYLTTAILFIFMGWGLIAIVLAQALAMIVKRFLSYRTFFTPELKNKLKVSDSQHFKEVIKTITPNSIKLGITSVGAFLVLQSSVIIGSLYISLPEIASYGITIQVINVVASLSAVYFSSYVPKVANLRVQEDVFSVKKIYLKSIFILVFTFSICSLAIVLFGNWSLSLLKSQTMLLSGFMIAFMMLFALLEKNHAIAGGFLLTKNEVPFFKASLIAGFITVILLIIFIKYMNLGLWGMILAPGLANIYNNIKWPSEMFKQLNLKR